MKRVCETVRKYAALFRADRRGNVAVIFSLATLPLIGFVGASIDYSRANTMKTKFQDALDSTALMLSKEAATDSSSQLQANAVKYFAALFNQSEVSNISISASYTTTGGSKVVVNGTGSVPTNFMQILGYRNMTIGGSSTASWGSNRLRVALVLDNTGSMSESNKMSALKTATKNLLTQLQSAASVNGDVYVSIVPFVKDVNVGTANRDASWIDWSAMQPVDGSGNPNVPDGSVGAGSSCPYSSRSDGFTCVTTPGGSRSASTIPSSVTVNGVTYTGPICPSNSIGCYDSTLQTTTVSSCSGRSNCTCTGGGGGWGGGWGGWGGGSNNGGGSSQTCTQTTYSHTWFVDKTKWTGCVMDRGNFAGPDTVNNYDTTVDQPSASVSSSLYPAEQYSACPSAAVMPLSYDWSAMTSLVNNMSANGSTNQAIGLQLGWMSLVGGGPFPTPPTEDSNYKYSHIIILLTDGLNTQNRWYGNGSSVGTSDDAKIDAREETTCSNFKAASTSNILYTIQVNTGGDPTSTLLQRCASSSDKFFLLTSASQIVSTFQTIGTNLTQLRIAK